ncbi:MAG TPA: metal ABC transporter permease [Actinomycetaceae bacterium]|nr:metal ABC transporter permease [Actinomycetaceae bacterium]
MNELVELLQLAAVQRSFIALILASLGLPLAGIVLVGLDLVPMRFAIMHVALLGAAIGLLIGVDPIGVGIVLSAVAGGLLAPMSRSRSGFTGAIALLLTVAIALALLVLAIAGVNAAGAFELLWGSILATRPADLWVIGGISLLLLAFFVVKRRQLALVLHDRELALTSGVHADALVIFLLVTVAVAIAASIRLTGALLVDAVTLLPALAARNLADSLKGMIVWSIVLGLLGNMVGLIVALVLDLPPGPILILTAAAIVVATTPMRRTT